MVASYSDHLGIKPGQLWMYAGFGDDRIVFIVCSMRMKYCGGMLQWKTIVMRQAGTKDAPRVFKDDARVIVRAFKFDTPSDWTRVA